MVAEFDRIGLGQWFRYLTGLLEIAGATGLLIPGRAFYGAALLVMVMFGALFAHLTVLGLATAMPAFVLLLLSGTIAYLRQLSRRSLRTEYNIWISCAPSNFSGGIEGRPLVAYRTPNKEDISFNA